MKTLLHLATPGDADTLLPLVAAFHGEMGLKVSEAQRAAGVQPLLDGAPHGAMYLIGPRRAPVGYVALSFGWSVRHGGVVGALDEVFVRPAVRGRGMGGDALQALLKTLRDSKIRSLHLVPPMRGAPGGLYSRLGFTSLGAGDVLIWHAENPT